MFIRMKNDIGNESKENSFVWSQVLEGSLKPQLRHRVVRSSKEVPVRALVQRSGGSRVGNSCRLKRVQVIHCLLGWSPEVATR